MVRLLVQAGDVIGVSVQIGIALHGLNHHGVAVTAGSQEGDSGGGGQNGATGQQTETPYASMTPQQRAAAAALRVARKAPGPITSGVVRRARPQQ